MNREISISVVKVIDQDFELVKGKILDIKFYEKWWKDFKTIVNKELGIVTFQPIRYFKIQLQQVQITDNTISFSYSSKLIRGIGHWEVQKLGNNKTRLSYSVSLYSKWKLIHLLIGTAVFKWKHSRDILKLIGNV